MWKVQTQCLKKLALWHYVTAYHWSSHLPRIVHHHCKGGLKTIYMVGLGQFLILLCSLLVRCNYKFGPDTDVCGLKKKKKRKRKKKKGRGGRGDPNLTISTQCATTQTRNLQNTSLSHSSVSCECLWAVGKQDTGYSLRCVRLSGFVCSI